MPNEVGLKVTKNFAVPDSSCATCDGIIVSLLSLIAISRLPNPARPASTEENDLSMTEFVEIQIKQSFLSMCLSKSLFAR